MEESTAGTGTTLERAVYLDNDLPIRLHSGCWDGHSGHHSDEDGDGDYPGADVWYPSNATYAWNHHRSCNDLLGTVLSWFGVKENTQMQVKSKGMAAKLVTAGPGAVLVVCGTIGICFCLQKEFRISSSEPIPAIQFDKSTGPQ